MRFSESLTNITSALCKVQAEIKNPIKNQTNKGVQGSPKYANLEDTLQEYVRPITSKYGIAIYQSVKTCEDGKAVGVSTVLFHNSGEFIESDYVYCDVKIPVSKEGKEILTQGQAIGVCITYLRRYSLNSALGINGDKDTDGSYEDIQADNKPYSTQNNNTQANYQPRPNQANNKAVVSAGADGSSVITFGKHSGKTIKEIIAQDKQYAEWMSNNERTEQSLKDEIKALLNASSEPLKEESVQEEMPNLIEQPIGENENLPF